MRLDRLLWFLRFAKSRSLAQRWIAEGHIRRNGERVLRQDQAIAVGDILTLPLRSRVLPIEILVLPTRRGPAAEAGACYRALDERDSMAIADRQTAPEKGPAQP